MNGDDNFTFEDLMRNMRKANSKSSNTDEVIIAENCKNTDEVMNAENCKNTDEVMKTEKCVNVDEVMKTDGLESKESLATVYAESEPSDNDYAGLFETLGVPYSSEAELDLSKDEKYKHMHEGRRKRVDISVDRDPDLSSFAQHEILEYLLFANLPRLDTNVIAHDLINTFGNLSSVLSSTVDELIKVPNITERTARLLTAIIPVARQCEISRIKSNGIIANTGDAVDLFQPHFTNRNTELLYLLSLSAQDRIIKIDLISDGGTNYAAFNLRKILNFACRNEATKVILAHNHPSGESKPSADDIEATSKIILALATAGIHVVDHIIFTPTDYYSFFLNGIMEKAYVVCDTLIGTSFVQQMYERRTLLPGNSYIFEDNIKQ